MTLYKTNIKCNAGIDNGSVGKGRVYIGLFCLTVCLILSKKCVFNKGRLTQLLFICSYVCLSLLEIEKHSTFLLKRSSVNVKMLLSAVPTDWMQFCT